MRKLYADSTVGMTAYNVLAMSGQPMDLDEIHTVAVRMQHTGLDKDQLAQALQGLIERKRILHKDGIYTFRAHERLFVVQRDLSDYNWETMEGGWEGWQVKDPRIRNGVGVRPIESQLGLPPTNRAPRPLSSPPQVRGAR